MKKGILRVLGVVVTLALLIAALPASIASAAYVDDLVIKIYKGLRKPIHTITVREAKLTIVFRLLYSVHHRQATQFIIPVKKPI